jgi:hypothetical protein
MLLRTIALQYYDLQRSTDIREVTYSPLMDVPDLDQMGLTIKTKKQNEDGRERTYPAVQRTSSACHARCPAATSSQSKAGSRRPNGRCVESARLDICAN